MLLWFSTGGNVRYPGQMRPLQFGNCQDYDPGGRTWYTAAISSAKFVVIIINNGISMQNNNRLNITQVDVTQILKTLSNKDYVLVLTAANETNALGFDNVVVGNAANKKNLSLALSNNLTLQNTLINYTRAFQKAFQLLDASLTNSIKPSCDHSVVSFLLFSHEGILNSSQIFENVSSIIDSKNSTYSSRLFTFDMLSGGFSGTDLQDLACKYQGATFKITGPQTTSGFFTHIDFYYTILASGINITNPIWTEPYEDAWGYGQMVTVSMPVYKYEMNGNSKIRIVQGVVAIDVLISYIQTLGVSLSEAIINLSENPACFSNLLNDCDLDTLRKQQNQRCNIANCSTTLTEESCIPTTSQLFASSISNDRSICCTSQPPIQYIKIILGKSSKQCHIQPTKLENELNNQYKNNSYSIA